MTPAFKTLPNTRQVCKTLKYVYSSQYLFTNQIQNVQILHHPNLKISLHHSLLIHGFELILARLHSFSRLGCWDLVQLRFEHLQVSFIRSRILSRRSLPCHQERRGRSFVGQRRQRMSLIVLFGFGLGCSLFASFRYFKKLSSLHQH